MEIPKKAWTKTVVLIGLVILVLSACEREKQEPKTEGTQEVKERIRVLGSASVVPLVRLLAQEFERYHPEVEMVFLPETHTKGGLAATREGDADIGLLSRGLTPEESKFGLQYLHLTQDGLVFATHKGVRLENVTRQQLIEIYSGKITNWQQVGGENKPITVLDRPEHTSPKITLRSQLFGEDTGVTKSAVLLERPSQMSESLTAIPYSIGYTSLGEVFSSDLDVNVLNVDGIHPTPSNVKKNLYPFSRPFGIVINPTPSREVMKFVDFVYSNSALRLIEANGYTPIMSHFVIATIPERNILRQEERYRPLVNYLSQKLGSPVKIGLRHLPSYQEIVDEFLDGRVNAAFFGSFVYALTHAKVGVDAVARPVKDGISQYRGLIFARKDSGIRDWRDLKGRNFAMIRATTAGEIFPRMFLKDQGVENVEDYFGAIQYVGSHDVAILKVLYGEIEAGAAKDLIFEKLAREDPTIERELVILAESDPVPENALVIRRDIDFVCFNCHQPTAGKGGEKLQLEKNYSVNLRNRLKEILLTLSKSPEGREILRNFGADRFVETTHDDYRELYRMIEDLGIDLRGYPYGKKSET